MIILTPTTPKYTNIGKPNGASKNVPKAVVKLELPIRPNITKKNSNKNGAKYQLYFARSAIIF